MDATANRLTFDDDLFQRARRVLGIPLVNQALWRLDRPIPADRLADLHRRLATGPLGRRIVRSWVPGARDRWVPSDSRLPVQIDEHPLGADEIVDWAELHASSDLDPESGPAWALATAPTHDGGAVLSYIASHVICDGGAFIGSFVAAADGRDIGRLPADDPAVRWGDDLRDGSGQLARAVAGVGRAVRTRRAVAPTDAAQTSVQTGRRAGRPGDDIARRPATVIVDCDASRWDEVARTHGGTGNSLLVALSVEILVASGRAEAGRPVRVSLPVSRRASGDLRANATSGVTVTVDTALVDGVGRVPDLASIRSRSREAFVGLADGTRTDPLDPLKPLLQMLPDAVVARCAGAAPSPLCLSSNLGDLPSSFAHPLGVTSRSVVLRTVPQEVTPVMLRRTRGGLNTWLSRHGDSVSLVALGLDPDHFADRSDLQALVVEAFDRWGLPAKPW